MCITNLNVVLISVTYEQINVNFSDPLKPEKAKVKIDLDWIKEVFLSTKFRWCDESILLLLSYLQCKYSFALLHIIIIEIIVYT